MPIRILHVIDTMLGMGGMEKNVISLIKRMDEDRFEHVICVVRSLGSMVNDVPNRARVICLERMQTGRSFLGWRLAKLIDEVKPTIVHSRNWGTIEAVLAGGWAGSCALVHSEHGLDFGNAQAEPMRRRTLRRLAFQLADRVYCVSYALRDYYARSTGFSSRRIQVIHNGVDTDRFCPRENARFRMRQLLGIAPDEFCIGVIGRLEPVKDLLTLLRAAAELSKTGVLWRMIIAGDGSESATLRRFVNEGLNLRDRVRFLGEVENVSDLLNAFDVYALPSLYEGISNSLLEAMATALPAVASAAGGNTEVIVDQESGLLFPVGDVQALAGGLRLVWEREDQRARLGRNAYKRVQTHFSMDSMIRRHEDLYGGLY